jgi:uncharacterized protein YgfB (UPF0149 family)
VNAATPWDYLEMARHLRLAGVLVNPAEAHGIAHGLTAFCGAASLENWQTEIYADCEAGDARLPECQRLLTPLYVDAQQHSMEDVPQLCLPPDDQDIQVRAIGLRDWCRGFLYGLGISGRIERTELSADANEALTDIGELARLDAPQHDKGEEDEAALAELQEYLRVAVSIIRADMRSRLAAHG